MKSGQSFLSTVYGKRYDDLVDEKNALIASRDKLMSGGTLALAPLSAITPWKVMHCHPSVQPYLTFVLCRCQLEQEDTGVQVTVAVVPCTPMQPPLSMKHGPNTHSLHRPTPQVHFNVITQTPELCPSLIWGW